MAVQMGRRVGPRPFMNVETVHSRAMIEFAPKLHPPVEGAIAYEVGTAFSMGVPDGTIPGHVDFEVASGIEPRRVVATTWKRESSPTDWAGSTTVSGKTHVPVVIVAEFPGPPIGEHCAMAIEDSKITVKAVGRGVPPSVCE